MRLHEYRIVLMAVTGILVLLVASPALSKMLVLPRTEFFTEFWVLGSNHRAEDYPFNITRGNNYNVFLGIGNRLGYVASYLVEVKFRNQTQSAPNSFNRTSSSLPSLLNITAFVADEGTLDMPLTFSLDYDFNEASSKVEFKRMILNDVSLDISSYSAAWDSRNKGLLGNLFFELWIYNATASSFRYHERSVGLWLNMTNF